MCLSPATYFPDHCIVIHQSSIVSWSGRLKMETSMTGNLASPVAGPVADGFLSWPRGGLSVSIIIISFLALVLYDQGEFACRRTSDVTSFGMSLTYSVKYIWNKRSIAGPTFKIPFMGPFLESVHPNMDAYKAKWASGELSCVSVFHK